MQIKFDLRNAIFQSGDLSFERGWKFFRATFSSDLSGIEHSCACRYDIGRVGNFFDTILNFLNEKIPAKLAIQNGSGKSTKNEQHHHRNYGDKKIGDDQAIAQTPQQSRARPSTDANHPIAQRE